MNAVLLNVLMKVMLLVAIKYNKAAVTRKCSENIIASR